MRYRRTRHPTMLSATLQGFLPYKLEPLGFSLSGQLRVASQVTFNNIPIKKKLNHYLVVFSFIDLSQINYVDKYLLTVLVIQPPPKTLSPTLFFE